MFSSNHPSLAEPYFNAVLGSLPLAKRRAGRTPWPGAGGQSGQPGLPGQQVDEFVIADKGGYDGVNFVGHIGPFGLHDWTDRAQRSNAAFAAAPFIDHWEATQDASFLKAKAYPFVSQVADFYASYMQKELDNATGTAWLAWPVQLNTFPTGVLACPQHNIGP